MDGTKVTTTWRGLGQAAGDRISYPVCAVDLVFKVKEVVSRTREGVLGGQL